MKHLFSLALAVLMVPFSVAGQTGPKPVPSKWLHDGRLDVPEFKFSVAFPNSESKWTYTETLPNATNNSTTFVVGVANNEKYAVSVMYDDVNPSTDREQFIIGMKKILPNNWKILDTSLEPSAMPVKGSEKFKVAVELPNGQTYYSYGYMVKGRPHYQIITFSASATEPLPYSEFVRSFLVLSGPPK